MLSGTGMPRLSHSCRSSRVSSASTARVTAEMTSGRMPRASASACMSGRCSRDTSTRACTRLHRPAMQALALARGMRPDVISAVTLAVDADETRLLRQEWESRSIPVQLTMLEAPYRDPIRPLISYVKDLRRANPRTVIMVFIPEYVVTHWWQQLLHNQSALRFKARLLFTPGVVVVSVPYHLGVAEDSWLGRRHREPESDPLDRAVHQGP